MGLVSFILAGLVGAVMMFFMDPKTGKSRRAQLQEKATEVKQKASEYSEVLAKQAGDKAREAADYTETVAKQAGDKAREAAEHTENVAKQAGNKAREKANEIGNRLEEEGILDQELLEQISAEVQRYVSQAQDVMVDARDGIVTFTGKIMREEVQPLIDRVRDMPGVRQVENWLEVYDDDKLPNEQKKTR